MKKRNKIYYPETMRAYRKVLLSTPEGKAKLLLWTAKNNATRKGLDFALTEERVAARIAEGRCEMTGIPFVLGDPGHRYAPSLDRIDCRKGYTPENTRVVVWMFNRARGNYRMLSFWILRFC